MLVDKLEGILEHGELIVYGAGECADYVLKHLMYEGIKVLGIGVTHAPDKERTLYGHKVVQIDSLAHYKDRAYVPIATGGQFYNEIEANLHSLGFRMS